MSYIYLYFFCLLFILLIWFPLCGYYKFVRLNSFYIFLDTRFRSFILFIGVFFIGYFWFFNFFFFAKFLFSFLSTFELVPADASGFGDSMPRYKRNSVECTALLYCGACSLIGTLTGVRVGSWVRPLLRETVSVGGKSELLFLAMPSNVYRRLWIQTKYATGGVAFFYSPSVLLYNVMEKGMTLQEAAEDLYGSNLITDALDEVKKLKRE